MNNEKKFTSKIIDNGFTSNYRRIQYTGEPVAVMNAVATVIRNDHVDRFYEHMLTKVIRFESLDDGEICVTTSQCLYAGD